MKIIVTKEGYDEQGCLYSLIAIDGVSAWRQYRNDSDSCYSFLTSEEPDDPELHDVIKKENESFITVKPHSSSHRPADEIWNEFLKNGEANIL